MTPWRHAACLAGVVVTTVPSRTIATHARSDVHDFHVSYTRMAVEPTVISAQIRVFTDDVTQGLLNRQRGSSFTLNSPQADAAFQAYLAERFPITANGRRLQPVVVSGAQEKEMWAYVVTWTSPQRITSISMHNAVLFELFSDQQNIVKLKHLPSGKESTLFYSGGSLTDQTVRF